jgi:hypothetical protein
MRSTALLLAATAGSLLCASQIETQHAFEVILPLKPALEVLLHSRIRTQPSNLGLYQWRAGPVISWDVRTRVTLVGGYYYTQQERSVDNDFIGGHRLFGGGEVVVIDAGRFSLDQRFLTERFLSDAADDFNRYRVRSRLSTKGLVAPYTTHEFFLDARGWRARRHSAGIRWTFSPAVQIDLGYLYEHRRADVGPNRHMWLTTIQLKRSSRRADPEI